MGAVKKSKAVKAEKVSKAEATSKNKRFLHTGCGMAHKDRTTAGFNSPAWDEVRLDIDKSVSPDIVASMTDMSTVETASFDGVYSSHNIEHLYVYEVPVALAEFKRVLKPGGFVVITCPDLQSVCALVAQGKLVEPAYMSPAGPITPLDILYGHRASIKKGQHYMAHRCGFTKDVLMGTLRAAGFVAVAAKARPHPHYDLWAIATTSKVEEAELRELVKEHFPN